MNFCKGAKIIQNLPNAGGTSVNSETISFDVLHTMFNATLEATELQLEYFPLGSKITDFSICINNIVFGVSVTRAMKFKGDFDCNDAERLLTKKLYGVNMSSKAVIKKYKWDKQILHIWAQNYKIANILQKTYDTLPTNLISNTIVIITICENADWIFFDK